MLIGAQIRMAVIFSKWGVARETLHGTGPWNMTDVFAPTMMSALRSSAAQPPVVQDVCSACQPGVIQPARDHLERGISGPFRAADAKGFARSPDDGVRGGGVSRMQGEYRVRWRRSVCWWGLR